jgi:hypothetical protein
MDKAPRSCYTLTPTMKRRALAIFAALAAFASACSPPSYVTYRSVSKDFTVAVPWGWDVIADADHDSFSQVEFIGPFDVDFYLGAPSLSVRWYKNYRPHALRYGRFELYANADDFIRQMLTQVYGKKAFVFGPAGSTAEIKDRPQVETGGIPEIVLHDSGLPAKYFAVLSETPAMTGVSVGTVADKATGKLYNQRYHEYAVVPVEDGFYVLCYPATLRGHNKGMEAFKHLIGSFHPYTAGPGGVKIKVPGPQPAKS